MAKKLTLRERDLKARAIYKISVAHFWARMDDFRRRKDPNWKAFLNEQHNILKRQEARWHLISRLAYKASYSPPEPKAIRRPRRRRGGQGVKHISQIIKRPPHQWE